MFRDIVCKIWKYDDDDDDFLMFNKQIITKIDQVSGTDTAATQHSNIILVTVLQKILE